MRLSLLKSLIAALFVLSLVAGASGQAGRQRQNVPQPQKKAERPDSVKPAEPAPSPKEDQTPLPEIDQQEVDSVTIETNLVTVPVIVSDRSDRYLPDLKKEEFTVFEDGTQQEIAFFETITAPFHVVLMIDTSASTQEKLRQIQQAAIVFTEQLQKADRVKVISFDDRIRDLTDFTSDRAVLQWAIRDTRPGNGTKLYDAMRAGMNALKRIKGRKAVVIFTDGVDYHSDRETYDRNIRMLEEAGIIVYPIRYDTREEVESLVRGQQQSGQVVDLGSILGGGIPQTTPPAVPGGSTPVPTTRTGGTRWPGGVVITRDSRNDRDDRNRRDESNPDARFPDASNGPSRAPSRNDSITSELDMLYRTGDAYLNEIAIKSGGQLFRADTVAHLPRAFAQIAAELRTQYSLGYYPSKENARDGKYHKIKVKTTRKDASVRARPGYRSLK